jgi:hypothetical protein
VPSNVNSTKEDDESHMASWVTLNPGSPHCPANTHS